MSPGEYVVGELVGLSVIVTQNDPVTGLPVLDGSGNPVRIDDPTVACTVYKLSDGTTTNPAVTHAGLGEYTAQTTPDVSGWWEYTFQGANTAPGKGRGRFFVSPVP